MSGPGKSLPTQKEIESELTQYLARKYGDRVKLVGVQAQAEMPTAAGGRPPGKRYLDFDIKPEELAAYLDEYVVRQDDAKAILATKICTHFNRIRRAGEKPLQARRTAGLIKNNVLLIGPTGVGKTFLIKLIANRLGVPFIKGDATKFSETGYVGGDVDDLVRDLVRAADDDIEAAQYGIIYLDEIDKIASAQNLVGADVSRTGVQRALLKPMEETEVDLKVPHDPISQLEAIEHYRATGKRQSRVVNTRNILFIMSGAFNGLDDIVKKRVQKQSMGFEGEISSPRDVGRYLKQVRAEDLIRFGFESEFIGRLPVIACLEELTVNDLYAILQNPNNSVVVGKKLDFLAYDIRVQFEDEALLEIATRAKNEQTGARGLVSVIEKILLPFEKRLPSTSVRHLTVTLALVQDPEAELAALLRDPGRKIFHHENFRRLADKEQGRLVELTLEKLGEYLQEHNVQPSHDRLALIARQCQHEILDIRDVCEYVVEMVGHIRNCEQELSAKAGIGIRFSEAAIDLVLSRSPVTAQGIAALCRRLFTAFEYGLRLLQQKKNLDSLIIPAEGIADPDRFINSLVTASFQDETAAGSNTDSGNTT